MTTAALRLPFAFSAHLKDSIKSDFSAADLLLCSMRQPASS
jgi:hypothetical protein